MSVVINTNSAATIASINVSVSQQALQKSLQRLSSGTKIVSPADDAGGLAVAMKLGAAANRQRGVMSNLANSVSYLQTQDGALKTAGKVLDRISELKTLSVDPTKNASDIANYEVEFQNLQKQLSAIGEEKFNGIALFGSSTLEVATTESGDTKMEIGGVNLLGSGASAPAWSNINGISIGSTFNESTPGMIYTAPGTMFFQGDGTLTSVENNISGPYRMSFSYSNPWGPTQGETMTVSLGGATLDLTALVGDADGFFDIEIINDGNQTTASVDGGPASVISDLSSPGGGSVVFTHSGQDGAPYQSLYYFQLSSPSTGEGDVYDVASAGSLASLSISKLTAAIDEIATYRADNGAEQSRLGFAAELATVNSANLEAAKSRLYDVDIASESTQLARHTTLVQAGTSMLAQANQSPQSVLRLIG